MEYSQSGTVSQTASTGTKPGPEFKRLFPEVEEYARTFIGSRVIKGNDKLFEENRVLFADPAFFRMFSFSLVEGNAENVLDQLDKIAISTSMARKYFGDAPAINKTLTLGTKDYTVAGIYKDVPQNSQLKFDFVTQFLNIGKNVEQEQWWTANWITYFLLKRSADVATFQKHIDGHMNSAAVRKEAGLEGADYLHYKVEPLLSVHLHSTQAGFEPNGNIRYIIMFAIIAVLILIIACANYTNLATAQSAGRSGEIGMRKVMGASRKQVFFQFIGESTAITFIAAALGLILSILLIPQFNEVTGKHFVTADILQPLPILLLLSFAVPVSFLAGAYPALVLS
ncbi:MAG: ABC transporter permease, partial [Pedobacter sp.]